ncbi:Transcriptional regulatory protein SrrA [Roseovarius sp. THAF9]|uniref:response regulator n=1 Tax=Roseovarius sp. THAF9 TaxID=2587847 RepID=UPI0012681994|nr:response regulator [Roseovarius sp. THAF9]QFT91840.1 Transcriptional regulatory protein SrrA [Roseovarius sp. THAF9]
MKIMVVDDEDIIIALLAEHLKEMGFNDVTTASSGEEALEVIAARDDPFDCFLLDIKMGGMDGIELCSRIREMAEYRIAPIIMITSAAAKQHMHEAFDAGATDYMMKPIEQIDLRVRIQIAMLLVETLKSEAESRSALTAALRTSPEARQFDPSMRITYSGVPNMRDYFQLENRLLRLSEGTYAMTLLSIEIDGIEKLGARLGQGDFLDIVEAVAKIIGKTLPASGASLSYVGFGKFVCLILVRNHIVPNLLQARIRDAFRAYEAAHNVLSPGELELNVAALSNKRMLEPDAAIGLIRRFVGGLGSSEDMVLPSISKMHDRIFPRSSGARSKAG